MNYTPDDLQNMVFKKSVVGGYNEDMVNDVLDKIIEDYTNYIRENIELKDKVAALNEALQYYRNIENSLQKTLMVAQKTSEEMEKNSYKKSENIIKEAEIKAQQIINEANQEVAKIRHEYEDIKKKFYAYKSKAEALLLSQQEILKSMVEEQETGS
ncbi:MAG: DivIVA domain-containing protein [Clostridium sp.]|jgi:cell division initiation protein|nr:DivIVA domain-containing protein [Clostridium sp.]